MPYTVRVNAPAPEQNQPRCPTAKLHILWALFSLIMLFAGMIAGLRLAPRPVTSQAIDTGIAPCIKVLDGDTIRVQWKGSKESVRILGIDTPETRNSPKLRQQSEELGIPADILLNYGKIAKKTAQNWLLNRPVRLVFPGDKVKRDAFGRLLAYVEQQGVDFGERLLLGGNAMVYEKSPHPRLKTYRLFQAEAQKQHKGFWRNYTPEKKRKKPGPKISD